MKKFSFLSAAVLLSSIVVVLLISCQKEQSIASNEPSLNSTEETHIVALSGNGPYSGSIKPSYAASLAANYAKKYGSDNNQTQYVAFSAKDLVAFINGLQAKYKSDIIYVNFGVYGQGALPVQSRDYGRLTVFFTGNKILGSNTQRNFGAADADNAANDDFLNHGGLVP
ncbi:MAG: hypothetical protein V4557_00480 [Bacteroidota bacterium]